MSEKNFVKYLEFGAVGDGVTNDFAAIKRAHDYANENNIPVKLSGEYSKTQLGSLCGIDVGAAVVAVLK